MKNQIVIPSDVHPSMREEFVKNYEAITHSTGKLVLFAGDQKVEHLNKDFYGPGIPPEANNPEHLFTIAQEGRIGAFVTQFGLITRYAAQYPTVNYIAKLNGKTNLIPTQQKDPLSQSLWYVEDVVRTKELHKLPIRGVGFTVYLGSEDEPDMLTQACQVIHHAHQFGLVAILWMYPRGKSVKNAKDADLIAGAAGVATCLGADFVKINVPEGPDSTTRAELIKQAVGAAGNTKVVCAGGPKAEPAVFLQELHDQITISGTAGCAVGRNIFQRPRTEAIAMTKAICAIVLDGKSVQDALNEL